jgi:DUF1365 family protein
MNSAIYSGILRHRRFLPTTHTFNYRLFMMYLDLSEISDVCASNWLWGENRPAVAQFRRNDYLGDPSIPLSEAVKNKVQETLGYRPSGPIRMLTHLRYFGYLTNPVTFYYCFNEHGNELEVVVTEITNTPWNERHTYVLEANNSIAPGTQSSHRFKKAFHISPFMDMDHDYLWKFRVPSRRLSVYMENSQQGHKFLDVNLLLSRQEITTGRLTSILMKHPFMTMKVTAGIYLQATKLWLKKTPFFVHPSKKEAV